MKVVSLGQTLLQEVDQKHHLDQALSLLLVEQSREDLEDSLKDHVEMLEEEEDEVVPLPNVNAAILKKVITMQFS